MKYSDLPTICPECSKPFSTLLRPTPKWQLSAYLVMFSGAALGFVMGMELLPQIPIPPILKHWPTTELIILGPAVIGAGIAMRMPKVVVLQCHACKWSGTFLVKTRL